MAARICRVGLDALDGEAALAVNDDGRLEVGRNLSGGADGDQGEDVEFLGRSGAAQGLGFLVGEVDVVVHQDVVDGDGEKRKRGVGEALEEDEGLVLGPVDREKGAFGFKSGQSGGELDEGIRLVWNHAEMGGCDVGHSGRLILHVSMTFHWMSRFSGLGFSRASGDGGGLQGTGGGVVGKQRAALDIAPDLREGFVAGLFHDAALRGAGTGGRGGQSGAEGMGAEDGRVEAGAGGEFFDDTGDAVVLQGARGEAGAAVDGAE